MRSLLCRLLGHRWSRVGTDCCQRPERMCLRCGAVEGLPTGPLVYGAALRLTQLPIGDDDGPR